MATEALTPFGLQCPAGDELTVICVWQAPGVFFSVFLGPGSGRETRSFDNLVNTLQIHAQYIARLAIVAKEGDSPVPCGVPHASVKHEPRHYKLQ